MSATTIEITHEPIDPSRVVPFGLIVMDQLPSVCMETSLCTWDNGKPVPYCSLSKHAESEACIELKKSSMKVPGCYNEATCGGQVKEKIITDGTDPQTAQEQCASSACAYSTGCNNVVDHEERRQCIQKNCGCDIGSMTQVQVQSRDMVVPQQQAAVMAAVRQSEPRKEEKKKKMGPPVWMIVIMVLLSVLILGAMLFVFRTYLKNYVKSSRR